MTLINSRGGYYTDKLKWGKERNVVFICKKRIKDRWISLSLQTESFYKIARIAQILNTGRWRLGVTGIWKG